MFESYDKVPKTYVPDNRKLFLDDHCDDQLVIGSKNSHVFTIDKELTENFKSARVVYRQSLDLILVKEFDELEIKKYKTKTYITANLTEEESRLFVYFRACDVQLEILLSGGTRCFSEPNRLAIIEPIEVE